MRYGVTGAHYIEADDHPARIMIAETMRDLENVDGITYGASLGVDTWALLCGIVFHPQALHTLVLPAAPYNPTSLEVLKAAPDYHIVTMPPASTHERAYRAASEEVVLRCLGDGELVAFPQTQHRQARSGTWMTMNIAWGRNVPIRMHPLDGSRSVVTQSAIHRRLENG